MDEKVRTKIQECIDGGKEIHDNLVEKLHEDTDETIDENAYQKWMKQRGGR